MKKLAFVFSFIVCSVVFANAQTPVTTNDAKDKPAPAAITPATPNAPVQVVAPKGATIEANKVEPAKADASKEKSCSKSKENCNKGKDCCKKEKAAQAGGGCCKKDKASCHKEKEEAKAEPATPATPANPATEPVKVPGDN